MEETFSPPGDDDVLLAVRDHRVGAVEIAAVAGVEPPALERLAGLLRLLPVAGEHVVRLRQHLAVGVDVDPHADRRHPGPAQQLRALRRLERVPFGRRPVDRQQRRRLGEPVDLDELPPELGLDPLDRLRRRRRAGHDHAHRPAPGHRPPGRRPRLGRAEDGGHHRGRAAQQRDPVPLDPRQDLLAVHLAQHDVRARPCRSRRRACPIRCSGTWAACARGRRGR